MPGAIGELSAARPVIRYVRLPVYVPPMAKSEGAVGCVLQPAPSQHPATAATAHRPAWQNAWRPPENMTANSPARGSATRRSATAAPVPYGCEPAGFNLYPTVYPRGAMTASVAGPGEQSRMARRMGMLLAVAVFINYVDRGNLATAAPVVQREFHLSASQIGILLSAFYWTYAISQLGAGWLAERFRVERVVAVGFAIWSVATLLTGLAGGFVTLLALRLMLGLGESVAFPCSSKLLSTHVGIDKRGRANGAIAVGLAAGPAFGTFVGGMILAHFGWRPLFVSLGALSLLWLWPWLTGARTRSLAGPRAGPRPEPVVCRNHPAPCRRGRGTRPLLRQLRVLCRHQLASSVPRAGARVLDRADGGIGRRGVSDAGWRRIRRRMGSQTAGFAPAPHRIGPTRRRWSPAKRRSPYASWVRSGHHPSHPRCFCSSRARPLGRPLPRCTPSARRWPVRPHPAAGSDSRTASEIWPALSAPRSPVSWSIARDISIPRSPSRSQWRSLESCRGSQSFPVSRRSIGHRGRVSRLM